MMKTEIPAEERLLISDLDGVICDLVSSMLLYAYEMVGCELHMPWEIPDHDKFLAPYDDCSEDTRAALLALLHGHPDLVYVRARPYFCGLRLLQLWKGPVHFVTSRPTDLEEVTRRWLEIWVGLRGIGRPYALTLCSGRDGKIKKMCALATAGAVITDDDPTVISHGEILRCQLHAVLIPQPWNGATLRGLNGVLMQLGVKEENLANYSVVWR